MAVIENIMTAAATNPPKVPAVREQLDRLLGQDRVPRDDRTLRKLMAEKTPPAPDAPDKPWSLATAPPDDAALILPAWGDWMRLEDDFGLLAERPAAITERQAAMIVRLRRSTPDLPPHWSWWLAHRYLERQNKGEATDDIDVLMAMGPWRSDGAFMAFVSVSRSFRSDGTISGVLLDAFRMHAERTGQRWVDVYKRWIKNEEANDDQTR